MMKTELTEFGLGGKKIYKRYIKVMMEMSQ